MNNIERMEREMKAIHNRSEKLERFLNKNAAELDYTQRLLMRLQSKYMWLYENTLKRRIEYERRLNKNE